MRKLVLMTLLAFSSHSFAYTLESFCDEAYKHDLFVVELEGERLAVKYDKEAALAFEPLSLELGNKRITTDESKKEQESSAMLGFSTKMPWLRASEKKIYLSREKGLHITEQLQKTVLKSEVKRLYISLLLSGELESIYSQKKYIAEASYKGAKKKFESGRISNMELARFDAELSQSEIDFSSASAQKEELHHALSHMVLSHDEIVITDLGFVFYKNSPRYITPLNAKKIVEQLPPFIQTVGLFVNDNENFINEVCAESKMQLAQIIDDNEILNYELLKVKSIKVIRVKSQKDLKNLNKETFQLITRYPENLFNNALLKNFEIIKNNYGMSNIIGNEGEQKKLLNKIVFFNIYT